MASGDGDLIPTTNINVENDWGEKRIENNQCIITEGPVLPCVFGKTAI